MPISILEGNDESDVKGRREKDVEVLTFNAFKIQSLTLSRVAGGAYAPLPVFIVRGV